MRFNASHHCHELSRHLSGNFLYRLLQWARTSGVKSSWCTSSWWIHWGWNQNLHSKDWIGKAGNSEQKTGSAMMVQGSTQIFFFGSWKMVLKLAKYIISSIRICQVHQVDTLFFPRLGGRRGHEVHMFERIESKQQARVSYVFILQDTFSR